MIKTIKVRYLENVPPLGMYVLLFFQENAFHATLKDVLNVVNLIYVRPVINTTASEEQNANVFINMMAASWGRDCIRPGRRQIQPNVSVNVIPTDIII